jgi:hypothetical protein
MSPDDWRISMNCQKYCVASGALFAIVAFLHLLRVINGWAVEVGPWSAPMSLSWVGALVPAVLSAWAFRLTSRTTV